MIKHSSYCICWNSLSSLFENVDAFGWLTSKHVATLPHILRRRFPLSARASSLFEYVDAKWAPAGSGVADGSPQGDVPPQEPPYQHQATCPYQLVAMFPRRVIARPQPDADVSLQQIALSNNELFNVEIL